VSLFFEDIELGRVIELGGHRFGAEEIVAFAREFDPQPFHLSEEAARESLFGHLCASGWHTVSIWMRHAVAREHRIRAELAAAGEPAPGFGPSPGVRELTWPTPVYVDDEISFTTSPQTKRVLASRPGWGVVESLNEGVNQEGRTVLRFFGSLFVERRARAGA